MASPLCSSLLLLLILAVQCYCAPHRVHGGFRFGKETKLDLTAGGNAEFRPDGSALYGHGTGAFGGGLSSSAYAGAYSALNDHYIGGGVSGNTAIKGVLRPDIRTSFGGPNSKGVIPLGLQISGLSDTGFDVGGNYEGAIGADAKRLAVLYGGNVGLTDENSAPMIA